MAKRRISTFILIILFFLLQTTVFQGIKLANVVPNLLLILTVCIGYMRGRTEGLLTGLLCGLMLDMVYGSVIGLYAFIFMTIGFLIGYCQKYYFTDDLIMPTLLVSISDLVYGIYYYVVEFLMRGQINFGFYFIHVILPEIIYTVLISIIVYRLLRFVERWLTPRFRRGA